MTVSTTDSLWPYKDYTSVQLDKWCIKQTHHNLTQQHYACTL